MNWTRHATDPILAVGDTGTYDSHHQGDPQLRLLDDGTLECWYVSQQTGQANSTRGLCRATSPDCVTWTKDSRNPFWRSPGQMSADIFGEPNVYRVGNTIQLVFDAALTNNYRRVCRAVSQDNGSSWSYRWNAVPLGGGGAWDSTINFDGCMVVHDNTVYVFYAGAPNPGILENMGAQIGVATATWRADSF